MKQPVFGVIADDFTGATDIASMLRRGGMTVLQTIGAPTETFEPGQAEAIVVSLKSRSLPATEAVSESLAALSALRALGISRLQFKYCSTFDSTPDGNIGPVSDALAAALGSDCFVHLPSLPENDRRVFHGHLFVGDKLLNECGMENHPLNPMTDANLVRWLARQTENSVGAIHHATVLAGADRIRAELDTAVERREHAGPVHLIGDAVADQDLQIWAEVLSDAVAFGGGSGIATPLARQFSHMGLLTPTDEQPVITKHSRGDRNEHSLVLAGSCSSTTLAQIRHFQQCGGTSRLLTPADMDDGAELERLIDWAAETLRTQAVLIYSSAEPDQINPPEPLARQAGDGKRVEACFARIAQSLVQRPQTGRLVVAGGETSGAVVTALRIAALRIGEEIDPGVPWTLALDEFGEPVIPMALKSGNFGGIDFFARTTA